MILKNLLLFQLYLFCNLSNTASANEIIGADMLFHKPGSSSFTFSPNGRFLANV